jgi:hypothetical protein
MRKNLTLVLLLTISSIFSQKMKIIEGSTDNIKHINKYDVLFVYENLSIPNFDSEEDFLKDKMDKREADNKGDGERFKESWYADRENIFEPKFIHAFEKTIDGEIELFDHSNALYIMKIHTQSIYSGYNVGVWSQQAKISVEISFFSKTDPDNILLSVFYKDVSGLNDYNTGERIGRSYMKLAKILAKKMHKLYKVDAPFVNELSDGEVAVIANKSLDIAVVTDKKESIPEETVKAKNSETYDIIYKIDGAEIKAKVIEITNESVKYKKQSQLDGPLRNVSVKEVFLIIYKDGTRENFKSKE